ncbi:hypothetical protein DN752_11150 [Echinicola strongylocentroti]|uniref:Uncharacterized protein n=1 Tax=Echinicola strongylocentroti TaxID=1795355 RepID=A0A2Z4IJD1_9BACT|nr:hypothetical protein [Echinicola strongylocentroti]AWW30636.1 hypothetical protein DN752_11150 [Echinicola strongylocentroti]
MEKTRQWNEKESIQLIRSMMESTKYQIYQDRFLYFMWGYLTLGCAVAHYVLAFVVQYPQAYQIWTLMALGGVAHFVYLAKKKKRRKASTYMGRVMAGIWGGMGIALVLVLFRAFVIGWDVVYPIFMILYGTASYATAVSLKYRVLMVGGIVSSVCGFIAFTQPFQYQLILLMVAVLTSYIIPAHLMKPKSPVNNV